MTYKNVVHKKGGGALVVHPVECTPCVLHKSCSLAASDKTISQNCDNKIPEEEHTIQLQDYSHDLNTLESEYSVA